MEGPSEVERLRAALAEAEVALRLARTHIRGFYVRASRSDGIVLTAINKALAALAKAR